MSKTTKEETRGRKPRSKSGELASIAFAIRFTKAEADGYRAAAEALGIPLGQWIRLACDEKLKRSKR